MAESDVLVEANAHAVYEFDDALFQKSAYDGRYSACRWNNYIPKGALDGQQTITFKIDKTAANQELKMHEAIIQVGVRIFQCGPGVAPKTIPAPGMQVAPVNNILHGLFKNVCVSFDSGSSISINTAEGNYRYKAWLENKLSYETTGKATQLADNGWVEDHDWKLYDVTPENIKNNTSFQTRKMWFCDPNTYDPNHEFLDEEIFFSGRLLHDLVSQSKSIY